MSRNSDRRNIRRIITVFITVILVTSMLAGCKLADPEAVTNGNNGKDLLCGIILVDLLQYDEARKAFDDKEREPVKIDPSQLKQKANGEYEMVGDVEGLFNEPEFEGKLVKASDGKDDTYDFGPLKGEFFLVTVETIQGALTQSIYASTGASNIICGTKTNNGNEEYSYEGTIAISSKYRGILQMCRLYQRPDGSIYADKGSGMQIDENSGNGMSMTATEESKVGISGSGITTQAQASKISAKVNIKVVDVLEKAVVKEMNSKDLKIKETAVDAGEELFEAGERAIIVSEATGYILIEEHLIKPDGEPYVKRTAYDYNQLRYKEAEIRENHLLYFTNSKDQLVPVAIEFEIL